MYSFQRLTRKIRSTYKRGLYRHPLTSDILSPDDGQEERPTETTLCNETCRLLCLPAEIRNSIWELALGKWYHISLPCASPPLLRTCAQIRMEVSTIFFGRSTFRMAPDMDKVLGRRGKNCKLRPWLKTMEPNGWLQYINNVVITLGVVYGWDDKFKLYGPRRSDSGFIQLDLHIWTLEHGYEGQGLLEHSSMYAEAVVLRGHAFTYPPRRAVNQPCGRGVLNPVGRIDISRLHVKNREDNLDEGRRDVARKACLTRTIPYVETLIHEPTQSSKDWEALLHAMKSAPKLDGKEKTLVRLEKEIARYECKYDIVVN